MIVTISKDQYQRAKEFAESRIDKSKNLYAYRGESKIDKMIEDIIIGTVGEFGVAKYLRKKGLSCSNPDLKIYEARRKSFDQDLVADDFNIHVKSQGVKSAKRYGNSWLLQKSDKITKDPQKNDLFIFTNVDGMNVEILGVVKCKDIVDFNLLDECKVPFYRHSKHALYMGRIKEELTKRRLWRI